MSDYRGVSLPPFYRPCYFRELTSTIDEAKARARAGAPEGTLVLCDTQTAGRGRMGRSFESPIGNLYMGLLLRPGRPAEEQARLSFVAAVALGDAIARVLPSDTIVLKWPNDVLVRGGKISGILLESSSTADWLILGVGVNIVASPEIPGVSTMSLREAGWGDADRARFLAHFAEAFDHWYRQWRTDGFPPIRGAWLARAAYLGGRIRVRLPDRELHGIFDDLDEDGTLLLLSEDGVRHRIGAGDVFPVTE